MSVQDTPPDTLYTHAAAALCGTIKMPGDKSISHRALIFAAAAEGLSGDASLNRRPMRRVVEPLRAMGADIQTSAHGTPPLVIKPVTSLKGVRHEMKIASAQVKSALLLAGLDARGETVIVETTATRDHSERLLSVLGCPLLRSKRRLSRSPVTYRQRPFLSSLPASSRAATSSLRGLA